MSARPRFVLLFAFSVVTAASPVAIGTPAVASPTRMYHETIYLGAPNLQLTLSVVIAGGGPAHFQAATLVGALAGPMTNAEVAKLTQQYGAANVRSFLATFTFAIDDVLRLARQLRVPLPKQPSPDPRNGGKLSAALVQAGTMPNGRYDVGYMIDRMISHDLHALLMRDINDDPAFGPRANANFHIILTQAVLDLKAAYGL
jgi:hypothetical protein